ncbi:4-pyridoxate dehydrogenase-like [Dermacentor variabilis]|uniref:4-pyridoxate dehydrogenase-like n=1 Tax=Dermacentor variabilis TaxID=34621 RepID=UPI003F5C93CC
MLALLNDQYTYVRLTRDPTLKVQRDFQTLLADVFRFVAPEHNSLYFKLLCHNGAAPALHGLPKVNKPNVPLRPIVDYTRSPLYKLSAYLHQLLAPLIGKSSTHVSNSCDFIEKVRDVSLDDDEVMVSFDLVSLFTSIPTDLAVEACTSALESDRTLPDRSSIDVPDLKRLLCFCLGNTYFCFDKVFYRQVHVGAGSAGCVLANRLTADGSARVLLLEAGGLEDEAAQVPFFSPLLQRTVADWDYASEPQSDASYGYDDNINRYPRGKVLGGSSSINHLISARGNKRDYDTWKSEYGAVGWSYDDVLPFFKDIESSDLGYDDEYHGFSGEVPVSFPTYHTLASDVFLQAGEEIGYKLGDYNGENQNYFSRVQNNIRNGERWSSSRSFIGRKVRARENLDVGLHCHVTKVLFEGSTAVGVEYNRYIGNHTVRAKREVILSAGAIGSAHLLMLSGIGPRLDLEALQIPVVADLPVGRNLKDHITVNGIAATAREDIIIDYYKLSTIPSYALRRTGPLTRAFGVECVAFLSTSRTDPNYPDIQFLLTTLNPTTPEAEYLSRQIGMSQKIYDGLYKRKRGEYVFQVVPVLLRPESTGILKLRNADPKEYPIIDPKFLSTEADRDTIVEGVRLAVQTLSTEAMKKANVSLWETAVPGCEDTGPVWSDSYLHCFVRQTSQSGWHPCCTAPMGAHPEAVLDARLRVRGNISRLRVVDASSMPSLISGNLNFPMMMMGNKAAVMIIEDNA